MATQPAQLSDIPPHVPAELVADFDAYHPILADEDYQTAFSRLNDAAIPDIFWSPYNGGHWVRRHSAGSTMQPYRIYSGPPIMAAIGC